MGVGAREHLRIQARQHAGEHARGQALQVAHARARDHAAHAPAHVVGALVGGPEQAEAQVGSSAVAKVRIDLERGRKLRSSGDPEGALPLFEAAFARACNSGEHYLAGDAAHMCALAVSDDRAAMDEWTQRGLDLGEREPVAAYWAGPLLSNLGWAYFDAGEHEHALELFERALEVRRLDPDNRDAIAFAEEAVQTARQALGT